MITYIFLFYCDKETLQIFGGTLTEITCSGAAPSFSLMRQEQMPESYDDLPDLFGIEAKFFSAGNNVTLYINGTNRSNNVTVTCGNTYLHSGRSPVLFTLTLEFVSKFITQPDHFVIQWTRWDHYY